MAPNGMMMIYSGLLLRMRNEAQLAAVLGHEYVHYSQQHSLKIFREVKSKTNTMAWLSVIPVANVAAAGAVAVMQVGLAGSIFSFSRENEAEADSGSIPMLVQAGYDPSAASLVWEQLRSEMDATAAARNQKSRKDKDRGIFGTHPPTADRVTTLGKLATPHLNAGGALQVSRAEYRQALVNFWAGFIDDQIKLNDFGGTEFLLQSLAGDGWTSELLYARGELYRARGKPEDLKQSAVYYRDATAQEDAPPEAWRGLGLALLRTGDTDAGKAALKQYLQRHPNAPDKAMMAMLAGE
jgi:predicted Zn-dependent protease